MKTSHLKTPGFKDIDIQTFQDLKNEDYTLIFCTLIWEQMPFPVCFEIYWVNRETNEITKTNLETIIQDGLLWECSIDFFSDSFDKEPFGNLLEDIIININNDFKINFTDKNQNNYTLSKKFFNQLKEAII